MKLSQKKTCERCRAAWSSTHGSKCDLGFELKGYYAPAGPCLKPLTNKEMTEAVMNKDNYR